MGNLGNWPLNTTERWMRTAVTQDTSQGRLDKLQEIRYGGEGLKRGWETIGHNIRQ